MRGLRVGPHWFQVLSIACGPAVVVGAAIVHTDGIDFRLLGPPWLTIGLFMAIPGLYAALLTVLAERLLAENGWFAHAPLRFAAAPLTLWIPLAPLLGVLVLLWAPGEGMRRTPRGATALGHPVNAWAARLGLAGIFVLGLVDLGKAQPGSCERGRKDGDLHFNCAVRHVDSCPRGAGQKVRSRGRRAAGSGHR